MTSAAAIHTFLSGFGLTAYEENSVPSGEEAPAMPYLTYSQAQDFFGGEAPLQVSLWYRNTSNVVPDAKAEQIGGAVGMGGVILRCDGGAVWLKRGSPFCQSMGDMDETIKRRYINLIIEFLTQ